MDSLIRVLNDEDRQALAWLQRHVGEARVADAARQLAHSGRPPFVSALCRHLGVWPPAAAQSSRRECDRSVALKHLAQMRQLLSQLGATKLRA
jgi:hypothetical protein